MIFIFIILFIALVVASLVYLDANNIEKIEIFLDQQNCKTIDYSNGVYQAVCADKVIIMKNGFTIDLGDAKTIYYKTLKGVKIAPKKLILQSHKNFELNFKDETSTKEFLRKLEEKRNK